MTFIEANTPAILVDCTSSHNNIIFYIRTNWIYTHTLSLLMFLVCITCFLFFLIYNCIITITLVIVILILFTSYYLTFLWQSLKANDFQMSALVKPEWQQASSVLCLISFIVFQTNIQYLQISQNTVSIWFNSGASDQCETKPPAHLTPSGSEEAAAPVFCVLGHTNSS